MKHEDAVAYMKQHGPLPEQPPLESRTCAHAGAPRPCSCHLTLQQQAVAEELGNYTLYVLGVPYRGRVKIPFHPAVAGPVGPSAAFSISFDEHHVHNAADLERLSALARHLSEVITERLGGPTQEPVAAVASAADQVPVAPTAPASSNGASRPKRAFDPIYNAAYAKARRRGPEAVAAFKAEWAAKKKAAA